MDLIALVRGFMAATQKKLSVELSEKYGVPPEEVGEIVSTFLEDKYGPAERIARIICSNERFILLFIGRKDCAICQKNWPYVECFLRRHVDLELVKLDYSEPEGLLYHMIQQKDKGMLPLIAMISRGSIKMISTGECVPDAIYEKYYNDLVTESSQNIYAV